MLNVKILKNTIGSNTFSGVVLVLVKKNNIVLVVENCQRILNWKLKMMLYGKFINVLQITNKVPTMTLHWWNLLILRNQVLDMNGKQNTQSKMAQMENALIQ